PAPTGRFWPVFVSARCFGLPPAAVRSSALHVAAPSFLLRSNRRQGDLRFQDLCTLSYHRSRAITGRRPVSALIRTGWSVVFGRDEIAERVQRTGEHLSKRGIRRWRYKRCCLSDGLRIDGLRVGARLIQRIEI